MARPSVKLREIRESREFEDVFGHVPRTHIFLEHSERNGSFAICCFDN